MPQPIRFLGQQSAPSELAAESACAQQQHFEVVQQVEVEGVQLPPAHQLDVQVDCLGRESGQPGLLFLVHQLFEVEAGFFEAREVRPLGEVQVGHLHVHEEVVLRGLQVRRTLGQEVFEEQDGGFSRVYCFEELQVVQEQRVQLGLLAVSVEEAEARDFLRGDELVREQFVADGEETAEVGVRSDLSEVVVWVEVEAVGCEVGDSSDGRAERGESGERGLLWPDEEELAAEDVALEVREHDHREVLEGGVVQVAQRDSALRFEFCEGAVVFLSERVCPQARLR